MEKVIADVEREISRRSAEMLELLIASLRAASVSGEEKVLVHLLANWAQAQGFGVDLWNGDEAELERKFGAMARHIPLANRPTLHVALDGNSERRSLLFNGHSDVVAAPEPQRWRFDPWSGQADGTMVYGRGACDVKGAIVAALWAMIAVRDVVPAAMRGVIGMELVPGEEDCVGLGTLTSIARGYKSDGVVVLEPTEGMPRCASRGGCRFEIIATGRAVHGTVKWLGVDAIATMHRALTALNNIERRWNDRSADPLFSAYPIMRPITVDKIEGGVWQGMICDRCRCGGYLELLPGDDLDESKARLREELAAELQESGQDEKNVRIEFGEEYYGHRTETENAFCLAAMQSVVETNAWSGWRGFNSGCEAGVRARLLGTPTLVWGPGSLEFAHAVDERIDFRDIELTARRFGALHIGLGPTQGAQMTLKHGAAIEAVNEQTTQRSRQWFERARKVLAGGISSSARTVGEGGLGYPLYIERGKGAHIWDVDGHQYIDYLLSYGSVILGHADGEMQEALREQIELGTMFGTCNMLEVELAEEICHLVPGAELVRYANSGSEAMCGAVRAARGYTGRNKIIKFEGHYHGWVDLLAVSNRPTLAEAGPAERPNSVPHSRGIPSSICEDVIVCPWNDQATLAGILAEHAGEIAGVVAEPIVANNACIMPLPGYLEFLRAQCDRHGAVLIFDEIVTGFRVAMGGAQEFFGVVPDISVFSKALGGGLPISAFAGKRKIMELIGANIVKHGGTYNGNPLCTMAALTALRQVGTPAAVRQLAAAGDEIVSATKASAARHGISCVVQGLGSMFQVVFGMDRPARNYRDMLAADMKKYTAFRTALLAQGIHANGSGMACWFISLAHSNAELEATCRAIEVVFAQL